MQLSADGQGRRSPFDRDHGPPLTRGSTARHRLTAWTPAGSLASLDIAAHRKVLVTIPLRPGARPTPADAASVPASIPVTG